MEKSVSFPISGSVLTAAYNAAAVLERAVQSVQAQTLGDWEMSIVDDHSSDGTAALAENLARHDPRLRVIRHALRQGAGLCYVRIFAGVRPQRTPCAGAKACHAGAIAAGELYLLLLCYL